MGGGQNGRLKEHVFFNGGYWDLFKLALYRDDWEEQKERFARLTFISQELVELLAGC